MINRVELKKPTKNDMGLVLDRLANERTVKAVYRGKYVTIVGVRREGVVIVLEGDKFIVPTKNVKLVFDWQRELRTGF